MPQIQFIIPEKIDKKIKHYMIDKDIDVKSDAIIKILGGVLK